MGNRPRGDPPACAEHPCRFRILKDELQGRRRRAKGCVPVFHITVRIVLDKAGVRRDPHSPTNYSAEIWQSATLPFLFEVLCSREEVTGIGFSQYSQSGADVNAKEGRSFTEGHRIPSLLSSPFSIVGRYGIACRAEGFRCCISMHFFLCILALMITCNSEYHGWWATLICTAVPSQPRL